VSAVTGNDWQAEPGQTTGAISVGHGAPPLGDKLAVVRDTLIVFSMQLVFRVTMFLRHLNY
jgi:hypothetical protein